MKRFFTLLFLLYFCDYPARSQADQQFLIRQYNTENGLPSNGIKGIQLDEQTGFLWLGTEAGVVRYNGIEFKALNADDEPHIIHERNLFMVRNNAGRIFAVDFSGNIFYVKENKLVFVEKQRVFNNPDNKLFSIAVSERLYNSNARAGRFTLQFDQPLPVGDTATYAVSDGGLFYYSETSLVPIKVSSAGINLNTGFKIGDNYFVGDSRKNFYRFDRQTDRFTSIDIIDDQTENKITDPNSVFIWENGRKQPLMFNKGRAWVLDFNDGKLKGHLICDKVPDNVLIKFALYDNERNTLYIGTDSKGLIVISANKVESLRAANPGTNQRTSYYAQVELPGGNVLTNQLHVIGKNRSLENPLPILGSFGNSIFLMGDTLLWYSLADPGIPQSLLENYNYHTGQRKVFDKINLASEYVMNVSQGKVFLGNHRGIFMIQGDTLCPVYLHPADGFPRIHFDMREIEPGVLAIATCNSLLRLNTRTGKMDTLFNAGNYCVRDFWQYKNIVFIGTYGGGIFAYKDGKTRPLPLDKNKYLLYTHCFVKDEQDFVWISTNKGLFKASLSDMLESIDGDPSPIYYYYFGQNDGMQMTELNGGCTPCALVKKDKTISFPSMDGLLWVNPAIAMPDLPKGNIYIDQFSADGKLINPDSIRFYKLSPATSEIIVKLGLAAWCNKENIYIDYRLNTESNWKLIDIDKGIDIRFDNLPQGDYKLEIRKRNGYGTNNYSYKELSFHIRIPWYKQWWFYVLIALCILGLIAVYLKFRTKQYVIRQRKLEQQVSEKTRELKEKNAVLEKNDTIKTRLISIISHDIITPLKFVTVAGKNLLEKKQLMDEEMKDETIREMTGTSQELQLLSTNILNWIKYQNENRRMAKELFNVREMVDQVLGILGSLAKQKNLRIENSVNQELEIYQFYEPLKILVYNLLTNAIHFTEKGSIVISAAKTHQHMIISVKDQGTGMTPEQIQNLLADDIVITSVNVDNKKGHGLGYLIIKDLVKTMGASLEIESKKETGTTVSVKMPASKTS